MLSSWKLTSTRCMQPFCEPSQCAQCCLPIHMALVASLLARFTQGSLRNIFFAKFTVWTFSWPHTKYTYRLTPCPPTLHKNACSMERGRQATFGSCFSPSTTKDWALCNPTCSILICHWGTTGRPLYCLILYGQNLDMLPLVWPTKCLHLQGT